MNYKIEQVESDRESFGNYKYRIYKDKKLVANYWHDYRGDEHGIQFLDGKDEGWPVGKMIDFIEGGGSKPLSLSKKALVYLDEKTR